MINAGTYKAKVVGCFTGESAEKKTPYYGIEFELDNDVNDSMEFVAYLTEKTKERCLATLNDLGFLGSRLSDMSDPKKTIENLFGEPKDDINVVVEIETYVNDSGVEKEKAKIAFVNVGERQSSTTKFDLKQSVAVFKSLSFDGDLARIKKEGPKKAEKKKTEEKKDVGYDSNDIPF